MTRLAHKVLIFKETPAGTNPITERYRVKIEPPQRCWISQRNLSLSRAAYRAGLLHFLPGALLPRKAFKNSACKVIISAVIIIIKCVAIETVFGASFYLLDPHFSDHKPGVNPPDVIINTGIMLTCSGQTLLIKHLQDAHAILSGHERLW